MVYHLLVVPHPLKHQNQHHPLVVVHLKLVEQQLELERLVQELAYPVSVYIFSAQLYFFFYDIQTFDN
jgi:hypothetical protein